MKLSEKIQFTENIQPVCAPDSDETYSWQKAVVSGWGDTTSGGNSSNVLLYVALNVTTLEHCRERFRSLPGFHITEDLCCATDNLGDKTRDACQGDSGGPMAVKLADGSVTLVGLTSSGYKCAAGYPGVYAEVSHVNDWITNKIKGDA